MKVIGAFVKIYVKTWIFTEVKRESGGRPERSRHCEKGVYVSIHSSH